VAFLLLALTLVAVALRRVVEPRARPFRWQPLDLVAAFVLVNGLIYIPLSGNLKVGVYGYHDNLRLFLLYFVVRLLLPARAAERGLLLTGLTAFGVAPLRLRAALRRSRRRHGQVRPEESCAAMPG
jgi:hypothetical protein